MTRKTKIDKKVLKKIKIQHIIILISLSKILAIIDGDKFSYRNKIGEFNYIGIKDLVNNVKNNIISEISARKGLNTLNEIKNADIIKYKKRTPGQK